MIPDASLVAVFVVGLLGAGHCAGMCGGIVGALSTQTDGGRAGLHVAYSIGRIASYATAGALAGSIGGFGLMLSDVLPVQLILYVLANLMLLVLGLYLAGLSSLAVRLEAIGRGLWARLQPLTRGLLPVDSLPRALGVGIVWGWIPCGLVYSVLATALFAGSAAKGALLMASFGLGTLPNLLAAGLLMGRIGHLFRGQRFRTVCGALVFGFGATGLAHAFDLTDHIRRGFLCLV